MNKKLLIGIVILLVSLAGGGIFLWRQPRQIRSPVGSQTEKVQEEVKQAKWESPAGFSFSYNEKLKLDSHPEDEENYASLTLTDEAKPGQIDILVNDFSYQSLDDWFSEDPQVAGGNMLDTSIASLPAKKVALGNSEVSIFVDAENVYYAIWLKPDQDIDFWRENYNLILSSFTLIPYEGEEEDSTRVEQATYEQEDEDGAIYLPEETIE